MFTFRKIKRSDFALLGEWLATPHVFRWWHENPSPEAVECSYGGNVDGTEHATVCIALRDGISAGLIQRYRIHAYPQYVAELEGVMALPARASSIDYFIGLAASLRKGWGTQMIRAFVDTVWRDDHETSCLIVPTHITNRASWRALENAGFARAAQVLLTPDNPADDRQHYIYRLDRP